MKPLLKKRVTVMIVQLIISNLFFGWALKHVTRAKSQFKAVLALNKYVLIEFADMYQRNLRNL